MFLVVLFIVYKNSKKGKLCQNSNSYTIKFCSLLPYQKKVGREEVKMPYFNCPKVGDIHSLWKLLAHRWMRARLKGGGSGKEQLVSG